MIFNGSVDGIFQLNLFHSKSFVAFPLSYFGVLRSEKEMGIILEGVINMKIGKSDEEENFSTEICRAKFS
jgi:hypothetical protein